MDHEIRHLPPPDLEQRRRLRPVLVEVPRPAPWVPEVPEPRAPGDPWEDRPIIQIWRTITPFHPPPGDLREGELAVELATSPPRLWCGYPDALDGSGMIRLNAVAEAPGGPFLSISGGTLTGQLVAPAITVTGQMLLLQEPIAPSQAATKSYVDAIAGSGQFVRLDGSTMTGALILSGPPTVDDQAATKLYVDLVAATVSAFTRVTKEFVLPDIGDLVTVEVESTAWMAVGAPIYIDGATYVIDTVDSPTEVTLLRVEAFEQVRLSGQTAGVLGVPNGARLLYVIP